MRIKDEPKEDINDSTEEFSDDKDDLVSESDNIKDDLVSESDNIKEDLENIECKVKCFSSSIQRERGQWSVYYISPQSFIKTFLFS